MGKIIILLLLATAVLANQNQHNSKDDLEADKISESVVGVVSKRLEKAQLSGKLEEKGEKVRKHVEEDLEDCRELLNRRGSNIGRFSQCANKSQTKALKEIEKLERKQSEQNNKPKDSESDSDESDSKEGKPQKPGQGGSAPGQCFKNFLNLSFTCKGFY